MPVKAIARELGVSRNTVRTALASDRPPIYSRPPSGSSLSAFEPKIRECLGADAFMPATLIAKTVGWDHSMTVLRDRLRVIRPEYIQRAPETGRVSFAPGDVIQCNLWFPDTPIPVGLRQERTLPVLVMTSCYSRIRASEMIPTLEASDILCGMSELLLRFGNVTKTTVWDKETVASSAEPLTQEMSDFLDTLRAQLRLVPHRDPEYKILAERSSRVLEQAFMPGRVFSSPDDFIEQSGEWWDTVGNVRPIRAIDARPVELWEADRSAMIGLPETHPEVGFHQTVRLARDFHVRVCGNNYSVDPRAIGRFVEVHADLRTVRIVISGKVVGQHRRYWGSGQSITDPKHLDIAAYLGLTVCDSSRQLPRGQFSGADLAGKNNSVNTVSASV